MLLFYTPLTQLPASTFVLETKCSCFLRTFWRLSRQTMPIARRIEVRLRIYFRCLQWNYKESHFGETCDYIHPSLYLLNTLDIQWFGSKTTFDSPLQTWEQDIQPSLRRGLSIAIILKVVLFLRDAYNVRPCWSPYFTSRAFWTEKSRGILVFVGEISCIETKQLWCLEWS